MLARDPIDDIGLSRPTLHDVFLHLTGHLAEEVEPGDDAHEPAPQEVAR